MKIDGYDKLMALGKDNADAFIRSSSAAMKGFEDIAKAVQALAAKSTEQADTAIRELMACRSPVDLADLQGKLARQSIETAISESRRFAELTAAFYTAAFEPLTARVAAFQTTTKTAA